MNIKFFKNTVPQIEKISGSFCDVGQKKIPFKVDCDPEDACYPDEVCDPETCHPEDGTDCAPDVCHPDAYDCRPDDLEGIALK